MFRKRSFFERLTGSVSVRDDENLEVEEGPRLIKPAGNNQNNPNLDQSPWLEEEEGELAVDVYQTPSEIIVKTMISGVKPEDLTISITREMITIKGRRETQREISEEDFFHRELYWGSFARTILLPAEIEVEEAEALEKHGLLTIRLPKIDKDKTSSLKVKSI